MVKQIESNKCKNARVYYRIMPMVNICWDHVRILDDKKTVYVRCLQDFLQGSSNIEPNYWCFQTDGVFYNDTQQEIYETTILDLLQNVIDGSNAVIFSYGSTGTGKSVTISGIENSFEDRGMVPRAVADLIKIREENKGKMTITYKMAFIEVSRTTAYDLLNENVSPIDVHTLKDVTIYNIQDLESTLVAIFKGEGRKSTVKKTSHNSHSAHSVLTIMVSCRYTNDVRPIKFISKLHFVDLAGVDTIGNATCFYKNLFQVGMANLAKSQLEQFVLVLIDNFTERILVKQRLNVLIHYLRDSLNHASIMRFIGHIRTERNNLMMTLSILRFGNIIRGLKPKKLEVHKKETEEIKITYLESNLQELRKEIDIQGMIANNDMRKNITQDRLQHMKQLAEDYLLDKVNELMVVNFSDVNTILKVFKERFLNQEVTKAQEIDAAYKLAYEKLMGSIKTTSSRNSSTKKVPTIKSKESISVSQNSKTSKRSLSWKGSKASNESKEKVKSKGGKDTSRSNVGGQRLSITNQSVAESKPSRSSSKVTKKTRRKSSIVSDSKDELTQVSEESLPDELPPNDKAWNEFVVTEDYGYPNLKSELEDNEQLAKEVNIKYLNEVRNLQELKQSIELKRETLLKAQMQRDLSGNIILDDDGNIIISDQEKLCYEIVKRIENQLIEQQEQVLLVQTELKLQLNICKEIRKAINEQYDKFCFDLYRTLLPTIEEPKKSTEDQPRLTGVNLGKEHDEPAEKIAAECFNNMMRYESLKKIMRKEKDKMELKEQRNKKWIRSCKP